MQTKRCSKCGETKARGQFFADNTRSDGLFPWCKMCHRADQQRRYWDGRAPDDRRIPAVPVSVAEIDPGFGHWLAGFIDGEGCFSITKHPRHPAYTCRAVINLRDDDIAILHAIVEATRIGRVTRRNPAPSVLRAMPQALWTVGDRTGCAALVALLDRYPLRAKKAADFAIWREAVLWWLSNRRRGRGHQRDWAQMADFKTSLEQGRRYSAAG